MFLNGCGTRETISADQEGSRVVINEELRIKKLSPDGKPLKGVVFKAEPLHDNSTKFVTDENGEVTIKAKEITTGEWNLVEEEQTIDGVTYEAKKIPIKVADNCYDGVCFEGEVSGNELGITYDKVLQESGLDNKGSKIVVENTNLPAAKKIDGLYQAELREGGKWLKFTDYKYTRDGKPRTFYVAKKPLKKNLSWEQLYAAGVIYGPDVVDAEGKINGKLDSDKLDEGSSWNTRIKFTKNQYAGKIMQANGKKYVVRLLRGKSNYGESIYGPSNIYRWNNDNQFSEWNRVMLPITKEYRAGSDTFNNSYLEPTLREGASHTIPANDYKVQLARYNWFGDLTVGAYYDFYYNGETVDRGNGTGYNGQYTLCQEFSRSADFRALRGNLHSSNGAVYSNSGISSYKDGSFGWRPVLEFVGEVPSYDGMYFNGEIKGTDFITYEKLKTQIEADGKKVGAVLELGNDTADGGNWLKFTDTKYKDANGKPRVFYVAKKPITNAVSWDDLFNAGVIYGPDKINSDGAVRDTATEIKSGYQGKIVTIKGKKYMVRLIRGVSNNGSSVKYKSGTTDYEYSDAPNSEWNRSIVAVTKQYRGEEKSMEQALKDGNSNYWYVNNDYKVQLHDYNWFGDLTLGASANYQYNEKPMSSVGDKGQWSRCQEYISNSFSFMRGSSIPSNGAAFSFRRDSGYRTEGYGWRPVLELID